MKKTKQKAALLALMAAATAHAQSATASNAPMQNVASLSASGSVTVQQDLLSMSLTTTRDGTDANAVQSQLKSALDSALTQVKRDAKPEAMEVRTGNFSLYPRYGKDGKINGWQGSTELVLEGRDFALISATAGKITQLTLGNVSFALSRSAREKVETEAQALAIERFRAKATQIAKNFGFNGYTLREVNVQSDDQDRGPQPRMMAMAAKSYGADAPVPVEAGKTAVIVTVSGSVQMQ